MNAECKSAASEWSRYSLSVDNEFGGKCLNHCACLNGAIFAVTPGFLRACGSATHDKGSPIICEYLKPTIDPEEFLGGLSTIIRQNQTNTGPCVGCRRLVQTIMPRQFAATFFSTISLHDFCGCNSQCVYCGGSEYFLPEKYVASLDHEILFSNLLEAKLIRPELTSVEWGGGEPTMLNTFESTVRLLRSNKIRQVINTSGIRDSNAIEEALRD